LMSAGGRIRWVNVSAATTTAPGLSEMRVSIAESRVADVDTPGETGSRGRVSQPGRRVTEALPKKKRRSSSTSSATFLSGVTINALSRCRNASARYQPHDEPGSPMARRVGVVDFFGDCGMEGKS
jgi:hypothetical protein